MDKNFKLKIVFTFLLFCLLFLAVLSKAFYVQVINRDKLLTYLDSQIVRTTKIYPNRGNIYDRNGSPLAINIKTYSIFTIPTQLQGDGVLKKLAQILPQHSFNNLREIVGKRKKYTWLARKVSLSDDQVEEIKKLDGIYIEQVPKRLYPNNEVLSQVLGFVGMDNKGLAGIEYRFDEALRGRPKIIKYQQDAKGRAIRFDSDHSGSPAQDLTLTIDRELQTIVEKHLKDAVLLHNALKGGAGVMDAKSGEILAMANYPSYDPNKYKNYPQNLKKVPFVSDPFEPGSIFKTITIASALEQKIATAQTNYYCEKGSFLVQGHTISEAEYKKNYEWLSIGDILKYSSNIGTTKIAFDLTYPRLKKTLIDFNFGQKTNIEVPGESRGIFDLTKEDVQPLTLCNVSFGQGIATTGIQMLAAYAAFANGGIYNYPTIVRGGEKKEPFRVISKETNDEIVNMLIDVVENGTGTKAKVPYFTIAGKTSTAQRPTATGGYEGYVPGFIGFPVNVKNPFVIFVYIDRPLGKLFYGNEVASPIFKSIAEYLLFKNKDFDLLAQNQKNIMDTVKIRAASVRVTQKGKSPDFVGLDRISAIELAKKSGIKLIHEGIGIVKDQEPKPQSDLSDGQQVILKYVPPTYD